MLFCHRVKKQLLLVGGSGQGIPNMGNLCNYTYAPPQLIEKVWVGDNVAAEHCALVMPF